MMAFGVLFFRDSPGACIFFLLFRFVAVLSRICPVAQLQQFFRLDGSLFLVVIFSLTLFWILTKG